MSTFSIKKADHIAQQIEQLDNEFHCPIAQDFINNEKFYKHKIQTCDYVRIRF